MTPKVAHSPARDCDNPRPDTSRTAKARRALPALFRHIRRRQCSSADIDLPPRDDNKCSVIADCFTGYVSARWKRRGAQRVRVVIATDDEGDPMIPHTTSGNGAHHSVGMVVDDDALVRQSVASVLEDLCEHVYQAADGQEGLEVLDQHPEITLIVTDIAMPRLDGIAFAQRARQGHPALKVLFVSGMHSPPSGERFLAKPFRTRALVLALDGLLEGEP